MPCGEKKTTTSPPLTSPHLDSFQHHTKGLGVLDSLYIKKKQDPGMNSMFGDAFRSQHITYTLSRIRISFRQLFEFRRDQPPKKPTKSTTFKTSN